MSLKLFRQQLRGGAFTLLLVALVIATSTVTGIALFASAIQNSINERATHLLAADAQVRGSQTATQHWLDAASEYGLTTATATRFQSMAFSASANQLISVKAVSQNYPLKGDIELLSPQAGKPVPAHAGPKTGEAFVSSRLFAALNIAIGDTIDIGEGQFIVRADLIREPDSLQNSIGFAPTVLIAAEDLVKTGAVQVGSRIQTTVYLKGDSSKLDAYQQWLAPQLGEHFHWRTIADANQSLQSTLRKATDFIYLGTSLSILLAGIAIGLAARQYALKQIQTVAVLKTLGFGPKKIRATYLFQILLLALLGTVPGALLGWGVFRLTALLVQPLIHGLMAPDVSAYGYGVGVGAATLCAFAAPYFLRLQQVSPLAAFREKQAQGMLNNRLAFLSGFTLLAGLCVILTANLKLTVYLFVGLILCCLIAALATHCLLLLINASVRSRKPYMVLGLKNLQRHRNYNIPQIMMFGVLFMLVFSLVIIRTSLLTGWQQQLPANTPNHFAFNIFQGEKAAFEHFLKDHHIDSRPFYPMARARLSEVNNVALTALLKHKQNHVNYEREMNITWTTELAQDNTLVAGQWWPRQAPSGEHDQPLLASLESAFAKGLKIQLGDTIVLSVAGEKFTARVTSLRDVQWDSMNPNFYIILNRPFADNSQANWMTSFYLKSEQKQLIGVLARQLPTVSLLELEQTIAQVQSIIAQVSLAIEFIGLLVVASAVMVLITSVQATLGLRLQESAVLRVFGAARSLVQKTLLVEFVFIGLLTTVLACLGAEIITNLLGVRLFDLTLQLHGLIWGIGFFTVTPLITAIGLFATRTATASPPLTTLRVAQEV